MSQKQESRGLPPPARQVDYQIISGLADCFHVQLCYLSEREIGADAQILMVEDVKNRLSFPAASLGLERVPTDATDLTCCAMTRKISLSPS